MYTLQDNKWLLLKLEINIHKTLITSVKDISKIDPLIQNPNKPKKFATLTQHKKLSKHNYLYKKNDTQNPDFFKIIFKYNTNHLLPTNVSAAHLS